MTNLRSRRMGRNAAPVTFSLAAALLGIQPAHAAAAASKFGDPVPVADGITLDPMVDARLRWEDVSQPTKDADAVTMRVRAGFELKDKPAHLSFLAEAEGNLAIDKNYDAFPFDPYTTPATLSRGQYRPAYSVVADPESVELNRLQLEYRDQHLALTAGRQRINLDDERWVGSVGWRQNEQTFNAVRGEAKVGPASVDVTYANRQNTIYGEEGGPRAGYAGKYWFLGAALKTGPVMTKGFAYLLDYDPTEFAFQNNSSQSYGFRSAGALKLMKGVKLNFAGSFARQSAYKDNPTRFAATYAAAETGVDISNVTVKAGYELLGADANARNAAGAVTTIALQTPMATLHKFNGWADMFLTTPAKGLRDSYVGAAYRFRQITGIHGLNAQLIYHKYGSDLGSLRYGNELDAAIGLKTGRVTWLAKYADYSAQGFGIDTKKFWLQAEFSL